MELLRPPLPTQAEWTEALDRVGHLFGIALTGRSLTARNLDAVQEQVEAAVERLDCVELLAPLVADRVREWADPANAPRQTTAQACADLFTQLRGARGAALVSTIASFPARTSMTAMGRNLTTAQSAQRLLAERTRWIVFEQVRNLLNDPGKGNRAGILLADLNAVLSADEVNRMLADGLADLTRRAEDLLKVAPPPPPEGWNTVFRKSVRVEDPTQLAAALRSLADEVESAAAGAGELRVDLSATVARRESEQ